MDLSAAVEGAGRAGDPAEEAIRAEEEAVVGKAVARLPMPDREVIHLRYVEGMGVPEIARALGLRPRTVETRLYRARRRLGHLLEEMGWHGR